jgi:hypothetical protein
MVKKIPISLNEADEAEALRLADLLGMKDTYGWYPKTCRFSITFTLLALKKASMDIPDLESAEMALFFHSVKTLKEAAKNLEMAKKHQKEAEKYSQKVPEGITRDILKPETIINESENPS